jgi:hypothetical protein
VACQTYNATYTQAPVHHRSTEEGEGHIICKRKYRKYTTNEDHGGHGFEMCAMSFMACQTNTTYIIYVTCIFMSRCGPAKAKQDLFAGQGSLNSV